MTEREQLRLMVAVGARMCKRASRRLDMAEEHLARALDEAQDAREAVMHWSEATIEAVRRYVALEPDRESGLRIASVGWPDEEDVA